LANAGMFLVPRGCLESWLGEDKSFGSKFPEEAPSLIVNNASLSSPLKDFLTGILVFLKVAL
jgi:hypothetical protein